MAWNPSAEVQVARDAAWQLSTIRKATVDRVIVLYTTEAGQIGYASYGKDKAKCDHAGKLAEALYEEALNHF